MENSPLVHSTVQSAIAHADYMLAEYGELKTVYLVPGPDKYGRKDVVFVRPQGDLEMEGLVSSGLASTVYVVKP